MGSSMSSTIWKRSGAKSNFRRLVLAPWRVVEAQHKNSTRKLVDSDEEQRILEEMIDQAKPPLPPGADRLHYLLYTPFRYRPPLRHGSRFGTRNRPGIWYGAEQPETAFAETAYYRLFMLDGTAARLEPLSMPFSIFSAKVETDAGVDLTQPPFHEHRGQISSPTSYEISQQLGTDMRDDGVEVFRFFSARDPRGGVSVAVVAPPAFRGGPSKPMTWQATITRAYVEFSRDDYFEQRSIRFERSIFEVDGKLPAPAL
jgi:RES domain-containing protein